MYHLLSRGFSFIEQKFIIEQQLRNSVLNWLKKSEKDPTSNSFSTVFNRDINKWLPKTYSYQPSYYPLVYEKVLTESRERIHKHGLDNFFSEKEKSIPDLRNGGKIFTVP